MQFTVVHGDIAEQSTDVLVNAAGTSLRMEAEWQVRSGAEQTGRYTTTRFPTVPSNSAAPQ